MKHLILAIISLLVTPSLFANSWIDPNWEEMIRDASVIGLFEITEGGLDEAKLSPLKILKGKQTNDIKIRRFDNNCWTEGFQHERALRKGQRTYLFLHGERNTLRTPTPTTGIMTLNTNGTVNGSLFSRVGLGNNRLFPQKILNALLQTRSAFRSPVFQIWISPTHYV